MRSIAVTTTHSARELPGDVVVKSLEALLVRREPDHLVIDIGQGFPGHASGHTVGITA
jgi:hypothetical protein